ncbi:MAG TPA: hypothetical protein PLA68_14275 [Panacibacter sp.]|nr:hypothetical protein [Panacibacter sp.]
MKITLPKAIQYNFICPTKIGCAAFVLPAEGPCAGEYSISFCINEEYKQITNATISNLACHSKKYFMKRNILMLLIIAMAASACKKDKQPGVKDSVGIITSMSSEKCACCWGWNITIDGKNYRFDKIPPASSLDLENIIFPATVNIEWQDLHSSCDGIIDVVTISKR